MGAWSRTEGVGMAASREDAAAAEWDRLAAALNHHGICHVAPARQPRGAVPTRPVDLFLALATASHVRLQEASIPLLLTQPQLAPAAQAVIGQLHGTQRDRAVRRYVAASALQRMWRTRLRLALGEQPLIPPAHVQELGLPPLEEDYGRATLRELSAQEEAIYGYNAWAGYTSLMDLFLAEIALSGWGQRADRPERRVRTGQRARAG